MTTLTWFVNAAYREDMNNESGIMNHELRIRFLGGLIGLVILNQAVSFFVQKFIPTTILINDGVIFGFVRQPVAIIAVIVLGLVLITRVIATARGHAFIRWGLVLVLAGALSNVLDRMIVGGVVDYLSFFGWSTFNLADGEIILGAILLAWPPKQRTSYPLNT